LEPVGQVPRIKGRQALTAVTQTLGKLLQSAVEVRQVAPVFTVLAGPMQTMGVQVVLGSRLAALKTAVPVISGKALPEVTANAFPLSLGLAPEAAVLRK